MPGQVFTPLDSHYRWVVRDYRNPKVWTADHRARRCQMAIVSPRWGNPAVVDGAGLDNPWGAGKAIAGVPNLVMWQPFFGAWSATPHVVYPTPQKGDGTLGNPYFHARPYYGYPPIAHNAYHPNGDTLKKPPYEANDLPDPVTEFVDYPLDVVSKVHKQMLTAGYGQITNFGPEQGWCANYVRRLYDDCVWASWQVGSDYHVGWRTQGAEWDFDVPAAGFAAAYAAAIVAECAWADGLYLDSSVNPYWIRSYSETTYWKTHSQSAIIAAWNNAWKAFILAVRAARPDWRIVAGDAPYSERQTVPWELDVDGLLFEIRPTALSSHPQTDCVEHRLDLHVAKPQQPFIRIWQVLWPDSETDADKETWKQLAIDTQSWMTWNDASTAWQAPTADQFTTNALALQSVATAGWTPVGGTAIQTQLSAHDGKYLESGTPGARELFAVSDPPATAEAILQVDLNLSAWFNGAGGTNVLSVIVEDGAGSSYVARSLLLTGTETDLIVEDVGAPDGGVWTLANLGAARFGYEVQSVGGGNTLRVGYFLPTVLVHEPEAPMSPVLDPVMERIAAAVETRLKTISIANDYYTDVGVSGRVAPSMQRPPIANCTWMPSLWVEVPFDQDSPEDIHRGHYDRRMTLNVYGYAQGDGKTISARLALMRLLSDARRSLMAAPTHLGMDSAVVKMVEVGRASTDSGALAVTDNLAAFVLPIFVDYVWSDAAP